MSWKRPVGQLAHLPRCVCLKMGYAAMPFTWPAKTGENGDYSLDGMGIFMDIPDPIDHAVAKTVVNLSGKLPQVTPVFQASKVINPHFHIWWFPEIGVPPVLIHLHGIFHETNQPFLIHRFF